jgi:hypothetical protein
MGNRWSGAKRAAVLEVLALVGFVAVVSGVAGYDLRAGAIFFGSVLCGLSLWGLSR